MTAVPHSWARRAARAADKLRHLTQAAERIREDEEAARAASYAAAAARDAAWREAAEEAAGWTPDPPPPHYGCPVYEAAVHVIGVENLQTQAEDWRRFADEFPKWWAQQLAQARR